MLPWLIAGWILFGRKLQAGPAQSSTSKPAPPPAPPLAGFLFRLPVDGFETTRLALAIDGKPRTVGIFSSPVEALKVVTAKGWIVPTDVRALDVAPDEGPPPQ